MEDAVIVSLTQLVNSARWPSLCSQPAVNSWPTAPTGASHSAPDLNCHRIIKRHVVSMDKPYNTKGPPCLHRPPWSCWEGLPGRGAPLGHHHSAKQRSGGEDTHAMTPGWQLSSTAHEGHIFLSSWEEEDAWALAMTGQLEEDKSFPSPSHSKALFCSLKQTNNNNAALLNAHGVSLSECSMSSRYQKYLGYEDQQVGTCSSNYN